MLPLMGDEDLDWLGDLRWNGYPHLTPVRDIASEEGRPNAAGAAPDSRLDELTRENESLRAKIDRLARLSQEFERRLRETGQAYEGALMEAESKMRTTV